MQYVTMNPMSLTLREAVDWYYSFAKFDPNAPRVPDDQKLARMQNILARLGMPHTRFPSVLIAGTKGKGSTAALLASMLRAAGYRTGLYTSPHLHTFRERIRFNGELISPETVVDTTERLQEIAPDFPGTTFFEWVTALAFDALAREKVEIAVLEVGLGGRFDCTNVVTPLVSVITPISYDHMEILGSTLSEIAREKAGIVKTGVPVVMATQPEEARRVIEATAAERNAPLIDAAHVRRIELVQVTEDAQTVRVDRNATGEGQTYSLPLQGPHQRVNLATALAAADELRRQGWSLSDEVIQWGVRGVEWKGRFEIVSIPHPNPSPRGRGASDPCWIVVDGAHNRASAHALVRTLDEVFRGRRVHLIFGASNDKDIPGMLDELLPRVGSVILTQADHPRAASPESLMRLAAPYTLEKTTAPNVAEALNVARAKASLPDDVICVTGSLFIAAEARTLVLEERGIEVEHD